MLAAECGSDEESTGGRTSKVWRYDDTDFKSGRSRHRSLRWLENASAIAVSDSLLTGPVTAGSHRVVPQGDPGSVALWP